VSMAKEMRGWPVVSILFMMMKPSTLQLAAALDCTDKTAVDIVFLMDTSGSVGVAGFEEMNKFIVKVSEKLNLGTTATEDRVAVAHFSSKDQQKTVIHLIEGTSLPNVKHALEVSQYEAGMTWMAQGLGFVRQKILSSIRGLNQAKTLLVIMSDGVSSDKDKLPEAAAQITSIGVEIIAVSIGSGNGDQLRPVVGPAGIILQVAEFSELSALVEKFHSRCSVDTANNPYLLSTKTETATTTTTSSTATTTSSRSTTSSTTSTSSTSHALLVPKTGFPFWASAIFIVVLSLLCACACTAVMMVQVDEKDTPLWVKCLIRVPSCIPIFSCCCCCSSLEQYIFECKGEGHDKIHWALVADKIPDCEMCYGCLPGGEVYDNVLGNTDMSDEDNAREKLLHRIE